MADDGQQGPKPSAPAGDATAKPPVPEKPRPMAVSAHFPLLEDKPLTPLQAQTLFDRLSAMGDIAFGFPGDGCHARAHLMCERLLGEGHTPGKVWAFEGERPLLVQTPAGRDVTWWFHVAPDLPVQMPDGRVERMVIDPSLFDGPATLARWGESMGADASMLHHTPLNVAPPAQMGDFTPFTVTTPATTATAQEIMRRYGPDQEVRSVFACDLGECSAGERPSGKPLVAGRAQPAPDFAAFAPPPDPAKTPVQLPHWDTITTEMPVVKAPETIHAPVVAEAPRTASGATGAALGLAMGGIGLKHAVETGDAIGGAIAGANIATAGLEGAEAVAVAAGRSLPALKSASRFVPGANVALTVADGVYQVTREKTAEHRQERIAAVGATTATAVVLGTAAATTAEAAAITTGVTAVLGTGAAGAGTAAVAVAAAPVVLTAAAVVAVAYTGDKVIEAKRAWDGVDKQIAENGAPQRRNATFTGDNGSPDFRKFKHIFPVMLDVSRDIKDSELPFKPQREANGRIKFDDMRRLAESRDPKFMAEFERALDQNIAKNKKTMEDNDSYLPKWIRSGDSVDKYVMAQMTLADLDGAKTELGWLKADTVAWNATHAPAAAPQQGGSFFKNNRPQGPGR